MVTQLLNNFETSFSIDTDINFNDFLYTKEIEKQLNANLKLSDYSDKFKTLFIIFQCFAPDNKYMQVKEDCKIKHKIQVVELYTIVDYSSFKISDELNKKQLIINSFITVIENKLNIKDFSKEKFITDIKNLLIP